MEIYETQPERTDLPLVVMPVIIESMIEPFEKNFELLKDIARVRMYKDFTLDEDTIVERCAEDRERVGMHSLHLRVATQASGGRATHGKTAARHVSSFRRGRLTRVSRTRVRCGALQNFHLAISVELHWCGGRSSGHRRLRHRLAYGQNHIVLATKI